MNKTLLTVILTVIIFMILVFVFIFSGIFNIRQQKDNAVMSWIFIKTKETSIHRRIHHLKVPNSIDTSSFQIGFAHYNEMCTTCHGGPGISPDELSKGLFPPPPEFYKLQQLPGTGETFWTIKYGIKFTAMPAFGPTHDDEKIWAITDFLLHKMNTMSPSEYKEWQTRLAGKDD